MALVLIACFYGLSFTVLYRPRYYYYLAYEHRILLGVSKDATAYASSGSFHYPVHHCCQLSHLDWHCLRDFETISENQINEKSLGAQQ